MKMKLNLYTFCKDRLSVIDSEGDRNLHGGADFLVLKHIIDKLNDMRSCYQFQAFSLFFRGSVILMENLDMLSVSCPFLPVQQLKIKTFFSSSIFGWGNPLYLGSWSEGWLKLKSSLEI